MAVFLVPLLALPALAGLVVCVSGGVVTPPWSERPCPKKGGSLPLLSASDEAACVVVPEAHPAPLAVAPEVHAPAPVLRAAPLALPVAAAAGDRLRAVSPRGPPSGTLDALRTVVLRV